MSDSRAHGTGSGGTTAVLLAAGAGTRLGLGPKALLPFHGRTLVEVLADVRRWKGSNALEIGRAHV